MANYFLLAELLLFFAIQNLILKDKYQMDHFKKKCEQCSSSKKREKKLFKISFRFFKVKFH